MASKITIEGKGRAEKALLLNHVVPATKCGLLCTFHCLWLSVWYRTRDTWSRLDSLFPTPLPTPLTQMLIPATLLERWAAVGSFLICCFCPVSLLNSVVSSKSHTTHLGHVSRTVWTFPNLARRVSKKIIMECSWQGSFCNHWLKTCL